MGIRLAFTGHLKAGKTTCAKIVDPDVQLHFTSPMKKALMRVLLDMGLPSAVVYRHLYGEKTEWSRKLMQAFGNYARSVDPDVFVRPVCKQIDSKIGKEMNVTIDDVRFLNEARALRERGFLVVKIERPGFEGDGDPTEIEIDEIRLDYIIPNTKTIEELISPINAILREMKGVESCD